MCGDNLSQMQAQFDPGPVRRLRRRPKVHRPGHAPGSRTSS
jgi:hypothetical protein